MTELRIVRDERTTAPSGLDEEEQQATMIKAAKQRGGVHQGEELTVLPSETPPPGGAWIAVGNTRAPGSGRPYKIYMKFPAKRGPGSKGGRNNHPTSDPGTMARVEHKPNKPTGTTPEQAPTPPETPPPPKNAGEQKWLGTKDSHDLGEAAENIRKVLENPNATEQQITEVVQKGLRQAHDIALTGGDENPMMQKVMEQVGKGVERVAEMRTSTLENTLEQEERHPGSVPEVTLKKQVTEVLSADRQNQLLGNDKISERTMKATVKVVEIIADRKSDALQNLMDRDKQLPGSITQDQYRTAIGDLLGAVRQAELLGISRPKTDNAMDTIGEVLKNLVRQKTEARQKLIQQKNVPDSGVTDQDVQRATDELNDLKTQVTRLGISM